MCREEEDGRRGGMAKRSGDWRADITQYDSRVWEQEHGCFFCFAIPGYPPRAVYSVLELHRFGRLFVQVVTSLTLVWSSEQL